MLSKVLECFAISQRPTKQNKEGGSIGFIGLCLTAINVDTSPTLELLTSALQHVQQ